MRMKFEVMRWKEKSLSPFKKKERSKEKEIWYRKKISVIDNNILTPKMAKMQ